MDVRIYIGNLDKATTGEELNTLFSQAGEVTAVDLIRDRKSGESRRFAFITMKTPSEADKAVGMFNPHVLRDHELRVELAKPRGEGGIAATG